jgi:hypothetical protein
MKWFLNGPFIRSPMYIAKLMALSQSFAIVLNADSHIFYEQLPIQFDKRAPWAETYLIPDKPLITYNGRLLDYHWQLLINRMEVQ